MALPDAVRQYFELDYDVIPLQPGKKIPACKGWHHADPIRLWRKAPNGANVGIRGGGLADVAVIDCDEKDTLGTFENVVNWLWGYGLEPGSYPVVQTASGIGRHVYVSIAGTLPGESRNLSSNFGAGEFRYGSGAFVVAPPSYIRENSYQLLSGDFRQLPTLQSADIAPLIGDLPEDGKTRRHIPRSIKSLLQGYGVENYTSRSEAANHVVIALINAGYDFPGIQAVFDSYPVTGKYQEKGIKERTRWLRVVYQSALRFARNHESEGRRQARRLLEWAQNSPWPGQTGSYDQAVYIAHARVAFQAATPVYSAGSRDLALSAGVNYRTILKANKRLIEKDFLRIARKGTGEYANTYELIDHGQEPKFDGVTIQPEKDAFRWGALNKTGAAICANLKIRPMSTTELVARIGKSSETIRRNLRKMRKITDPRTGELCPLVERCGGGKWRLLPQDLKTTAAFVGTSGKRKEQERRYAKERRLHRLVLSKASGDKNQNATTSYHYPIPPL